MITEGIYNILLVSEKLLNQKLSSDLFPVGQMLKEARPLLNAFYLDSKKINVTNKNVKWYLDTTEDKLKIIKSIIEKMKSNNKNTLSDRVAYTLVLRIRTLYIIKKLIENKPYSNIELIKLIKKISNGTNAYERYLAVKNNLEEKHFLSLEEAIKLYEYLDRQYSEVKKILH